MSETAFFLGGHGKYHLRWFTPTVEAQLCGHATLATAFVIFRFLEPTLSHLHFESLSGPLSVSRTGTDSYTLDFPLRDSESFPATHDLVMALGGMTPRECWRTSNGIQVARLSSETEVACFQPDWAAISQLQTSLIITAGGTDRDFVYRYFAPHQGIPEDPVTGSAQCVLMPIWSRILGLQSLRSRQLSARGGELASSIQGSRVAITGNARLSIQGKLSLP